MGSRRPGPTALISIPEEDRRVDPHLGYPRAYAKLCRNGYAWLQLQGYSLPHSDGPPKTFLPYAARPEDLAKLEQLQDLFPIIINDTRKEHPSHMALHKFKDVLWQQLDHLGNAGFDPACFRVDAYGNVLYWHADPSSPLAWEVSHWFPYSRGGKTMLNNLRLVHWQVSLKKREKLEFLIPWWDLQLGVSVNQFLSAFESANIGFRQRCLSYLFLGGEDEMPDGRTCLGNHQWSHPFLEKQKKLGLAVAGLVRMQRSEDVLKSSAANSRLYASSPGHHHKGWSIAEEEALLRGYQKFGFGNWKAIKESDPGLANRSLVQIRDKYRSLTGLEKENIITPNSLSPVHHQIKSPSSIQDMPESVGQVQIERLLSSLKRESKIKLLRDEEKHMREGESSKLQQTLQAIKEQNEKEKTALDTLEAELRKQRRQLEKQRQWNETQTSYRICLERMIQETMHQSVVYKEESRLNEIACNSLMAQLESQAATCSAAESRLLQHASKKQDLLQMTRPLPLLESGNTHESESINTPSKTDTTKKQKHANLPPREERSVLQPRDIQNHMAIHKHDILSDSEEQHRNNKRLKKSSTTPAKRCQSAPRQRMEKENCGVGHEYSTTPRFTSKKLDTEMDKLYYEGNKCSKIRAGESRRTLGHAMNSKGYVIKPVENERMEKTKEHSGINNDEVKSTSPSVEAEETTARTFKLMPVIKNGQNKNIESGYSSCGSQRFKGILHAPQSRDSSEKFELDFSVLDSHAKENELPNEHRVNSNVDSKSPEVSGHGTNSEVERKSPDMSDHGTVIESPGLNEESIKEGKSTLDKWLQMLLLSTEPTIENEQEAQAVIKSDEECNRKLNGIGRTWPEDVAVPPPGLPHGLTRGYSVRGPEERPKKATSDKIKVPFSGFLKRLSLRQQYSNSKTAVNEADVKDPPRRQVTFEDWEGITNKLAAMNLNTGNANKLRSTSLRASTGSLSQLKNLSVAGKNIPSVISLDPSPNKVTRSVLYYSTEKKGEKQMANMKAMSRRASIDECAQAWKMGVNKLEAQQNN